MTQNNTPKITPFLWFDNNAQEAIEFYTTVFPNSNIILKTSFVSQIEIMGQKLTLMNGGPLFKLNEAISFVISTKNQEETDYYWDKLTSDGGIESQCGWCKDKFGLSWQVTPAQLMTLLSDPDKVKADRVQDAMMKMKKIIVADLEKAYNEFK